MINLDTPEDIADTDEDFTDLDDLLNPKPTPDADDDSDEAEDPDDLSDLDELLADAKNARATVEAVKAARAKAKGGYQLGADDLARIQAWELAREWQAVANVALFRRYECACGYHSTVFESLMLEQKHRHNASANRWQVQETAAANLPNRSAIRTQSIPACQRCALSKGWNLSTDLIWH